MGRVPRCSFKKKVSRWIQVKEKDVLLVEWCPAHEPLEFPCQGLDGNRNLREIILGDVRF